MKRTTTQKTIESRTKNPEKRDHDHQLDNATEALPPKTYSADDRRKIVEARVALGWSQKDLAMRANVPLHDISQMESGKAIYNAVFFQKIKRVLKIQ